MQIKNRLQTTIITSYACLALLLPISLGGCGAHFHRQEDAKVAQSAVDAFKDAKLTETVAAEFSAAAEILTQEIAAIRRQSNARRDQWLAAFIGGQTKDKSWDGLSKYISNRIKELAGEKADQGPLKSQITVLLASPKMIYQAYDDLRGTYLSYHTTRAKIVPQKDPIIPRIGAKLADDETANLSPPLKQSYSDYKRDLDKYEAAVKSGSPPPAIQGLIGETLSSQIAQAEALKQVGTAAAETQKKFDNLQKARDATIADTTAPGKTADEIRQGLQDSVAKEKEVWTYLQQITSVPSQAGLPDIQKRVTGLQAIRKEITDVLQSSSDALKKKVPTNDALKEKVPTEGDTVKIRLLASVSAIRHGLDQATYPKVSDLLLESERLRIDIQRLQGVIALEQERKTVLDLKLAALVRELAALRLAQGRVRQAGGTKAIAKEVGVTAERAFDALAYVAESWTAGRTPAEETDFLLAGIDHRAALENSSAAFAQWANLIGVPLSQLLAYHQSGIKAEDLANLISAAGLTAIAGGVY